MLAGGAASLTSHDLAVTAQQWGLSVRCVCAHHHRLRSCCSFSCLVVSFVCFVVVLCCFNWSLMLFLAFFSFGFVLGAVTMRRFKATSTPIAAI